MKILADEIRAGGKAEVKIRKGSQLEFEIGNKLMTAREITGAFPNWEMVLPKSFDYFAELNVKEFRDALTRVGVMADDSHRRVEFVFHYLKQNLLKAEVPQKKLPALFKNLVIPNFKMKLLTIPSKTAGKLLLMLNTRMIFSRIRRQDVMSKR